MRRWTLCKGWMAAVAAAVVCCSQPARADKIGDHCNVVGVRDNQLIGYGVVTGLNGTGDDISAVVELAVDHG